MKLDVIVFAAHPDDAELSIGGTIAKFSSLKLKTGIIDLTRGEMSSRGNIKLRQKEADKAGEILGIAYRENLGISDGNIEINKKNLEKVINVIRRLTPKIVFAPYFNDRHPDHIQASKLIKDAMFKTGLTKFKTKFNGKNQSAYRPAKLYYYMQTYSFTPTFIVDITDTFERKMKAVRAYSSQFYDPNHKGPETFISRPEFINYLEARARYYGFEISKKYGEPFFCEEKIEMEIKNLFI
jgi:bacillithiol biosynthesis deacetylase BshB1